MKTKPLVSWPGGKTRMLKHLIPHIPSDAGYIEVFAGGLAVLLAKEPGKLEVVNDINSDLVNLYKVAKHHPDALAAELSLMPGSRQYLTECQELLKTAGITDLQRAAMWLHCNKTSFAGTGTSFAVVKSPDSAAFISREALMARVQEFARRMARVAIENMDYRRLLKTYDHPRNLFFLDPPYLNSKAKNYRGWSELEMGQFHAAVLALSGRWIVTVDDSAFNRRMWRGHDIVYVKSRNQAGNQAIDSGKTFGEMIVYSPGLRATGTGALKKAA